MNGKQAKKLRKEIRKKLLTDETVGQYINQLINQNNELVATVKQLRAQLAIQIGLTQKAERELKALTHGSQNQKRG